MGGGSEIDTSNKDLVWNLTSISEKRAAVDFFSHLKDAVCVYSPSVEILYTNYEVHPLGDFTNGLVMLPNPEAHHDQFYHISPSAIAGINVSIVPGKPYKQPGFLIQFQNGSVETFKRGLMKLNVLFKRKNLPFLPVVKRGDLRQVNSFHPSLFLHVVKPSLLDQVSELDKNYLEKAITSRFLNIGKLR